MNTSKTVVIDTPTDEVVEVKPLEADATDDQKAEYYANLEKSNKQLFSRAKKAEGFELVDGKWVKPNKTTKTETTTTTDTSKKSELSQADLISIIKADVPDEDIDEVKDYAALRNISIADALKSDIVKTILANKAELRKTAEGTHTGTTTRNTGKLSDETLLANAKNGVMPESDEDMRRLITLQRAANR